MQAVVPAAGRGSRLGDLTADRPKPLVEVAGKPLLAHVLDRLREFPEHAVDEAVIVVGYRGERIVERFGDSYRGLPLAYAEQERPDGMADAVLAAESRVDGAFVVVDGDAVVGADLDPVLAAHRDPDVDGTTLVRTVPPEAARSKAVCETDGEGNLLRIEKEPSDPPDPSRIASAVHTFPPELFEACRAIDRSPRGEFELSDAMGRLVDGGATIRCVEADGPVYNVNTPAELAAVREFVAEKSGSADGSDAADPPNAADAPNGPEGNPNGGE